MTTQRRMTAFDGLKGLSILLIIWYHLEPHLISGGFLFVNSFIVLAGYFFARKMETISQSTSHPLKAIGQYLVATFKRIYVPLFWLIMLVVVGLFLLDKSQLLSMRGGLLSSLILGNNWYQIMTGQSYFVRMSEASPLVHLWYNALYFQAFLLAVPLFLLTIYGRLRATSKAIYWYIIAILGHGCILLWYQVGTDPSRVYYGLDTRFASFAIGIALFYTVPIILNLLNRMTYRQVFYRVFGLLTLVGMLYLALSITDQMPSTYIIWLPIFSYLSAALIFAILVGNPLICRLLDTTYLVNIGRKSYAYYLCYYPVIVIMMRFIRVFPTHWLFAIVTFVIISIVAECYYMMIEQPHWSVYGLLYGNWRQTLQELKSDWPSFEHAKWKLVRTLCLIGVALAGLAGIGYARDDMPVARFESEYRLYQAKPNLTKQPYPGEAVILSNQAYLTPVDQALKTQLLKLKKSSKPFALTELVSDQKILAELQTLKVEYADELAAVQTAYPDAYELLTPYEVVFAYNTPVTFFGDSLIKIDGELLTQVYQHSNYFGYISLQIWDALPIFEQLVKDGLVNDIVVINLGTNAGLDQASMDQLVELAGDRQIFFVNTNSKVMHIDEVNRIVKATADKYKQVHVIDWHSFQQGHPDWYASDEIHHSLEGTRYFIKLVTQVLKDTLE